MDCPRDADPRGFERNAAVRFVAGWLQGAVFYALSVPWFYTVMRQYGPLPVIQAGAVFALMVFATAPFHAAFALGVAWLARFGPARACLAAPFLWVSMEFAMMHLPDIGFPWNLLGYVAAGNLAFVQLTAITGIFGLSLLVASYNALAAWAVLQFSQRKLGGAKYGSCDGRIDRGRACGSRHVPQAPADHVAHLVQTNFPVSMSYPANWMQSHAAEMDQLEQISIGAAQKIPGVVVWPEVPAPFSLQDGNFLARASALRAAQATAFWLAWWIGSRWPAAGLARTTAPRCSIPTAHWIFSTTKFIWCRSANTCRGGTGSPLREI